MTDKTDVKEDVTIKNQIDFVEAFKYCLSHKRLYAIVALVSLVVAVLYAFSLPRYYKAEVELAPELAGDAATGGLSSLAQQFGFGGTGPNAGNDAIYPELYPDLFTSKEFLVSLFDIKVSTAKSDTTTSLYQHYLIGMKSPWWAYPISAVSKAIRKLRGSKPALGAGKNGPEIDPFRLSEVQNKLTEAISGAVTCNVDKHTSVISLTVTDQDPVAAAIIVDSVRVRLQDFIIAYRTKKARNDVSYLEKLLREAKQKYDATRHAYAGYSDSHEDLYLTSYKSESDNLENEMQLAFNNYSQVAQQVQVARAKVLEKTPVFTTIKSATVPLKPAGPRRMAMVFMIFVLAMVGTTVWLLFSRTIQKRKKLLAEADENIAEGNGSNASWEKAESNGNNTEDSGN
jgi:uncharacterized protein involved in exopolysaccharide biosynthesis